MRENCTSGSVRGAPGNGRSYRVISVGATNAFDDRAGFSTFSVDDDFDPSTTNEDWVDLLAPGDPILSTVPINFCSPPSSQCFQWLMGTSMAAPHVSGVAALVWNYLSVNDPPNANSSEVRRRIQDCAETVGAMDQNMLAWSKYGRLNAFAALTCGGTLPPPPPPPSSGNQIGDLDASATSQGGTWTSTLTVRVHNEDEQQISGATVSVTADYSTGSITVSCTTDILGQCATDPLTIHKKNGSATYTVVNIDPNYQSGANHDPDGDSDGTVITVTKP
ncbi:MAG: S8 family serine peptidase [Pseudomonadota bacterium]